MYYIPLCEYAVTILGEQMEAEDIVQDLFTYVWKNRYYINIEKSIKSYLFTSIRFRAINLLKHKMTERKHGILLTEFFSTLMNSGYSEEEIERINKIRKTLETLPDQCRKVFKMSCIDGMKYKEIADELNLSVNTVKSHIMKAYRDIRIQVGEKDSPILYIFLRNIMNLIRF